jgi:hypothetical protein
VWGSLFFGFFLLATQKKDTRLEAKKTFKFKMDSRLRGNDGVEYISGKMRLSQLTKITKNNVSARRNLPPPYFCHYFSP